MIIGLEQFKLSLFFNRNPRMKAFRLDNAETHLEKVRNTIPAKDVGIYVHVPFCKSTCFFCPYFRDLYRSEKEIEKYFDALVKEVRIYGKILEDKNLNIVELHVGGGTPSLVRPKYYKQLLEELSAYFTVRAGLSLEVNPEDFRSADKVEEMYSSGVDEVSIGVQSFDPRTLKALGRKHSVEDSVKAIENSMKAGFKWVNADIMFMPPSIKGFVELSLNEKLGIFKEDIARAFNLGVHQITYYPTIIPLKSPGYSFYKLGRLIQEGEALNMFVEAAIDTLKELSLYMTRIYSFSRKQYEYATVNLEMIGPLIAFGASAWSNTGSYQYINTHSMSDYVELVEKGLPPASYGRDLNPNTRIWRLFFDQMLTGGRLRKDAYTIVGEKRFPISVKTIIAFMIFKQFVKNRGDAYELTKKGIIEAYKAMINYIVRIPIKATEELTELSKRGLKLEYLEIP